MRQRRHRSSNDPPDASVDQRAGRADEPNHQRSDGSAIPLRGPRPTAPPPRRLRRRLQLRATAQDPQGSDALRVHLQMLDTRAGSIQSRSTPSNAGTKHLEARRCEILQSLELDLAQKQAIMAL